MYPKEHTKNVESWLITLGGFYQTLCHALADYGTTKNGNSLVYNLDGSLLIPVLWDDRRDFSRQPGPTVVETLNWLLQDEVHKNRFKFAVSGPMVYEFLSRFERTERRASFLPTQMYSELDKSILKASSDDLPFPLVSKRKAILENFRALTKDGMIRNVVTPMQRFIDLLDSKKLLGLADCALFPDDISVETIQRRAKIIYDKQCDERLPREKAFRDPRTTEFHCLIDAFNIVISRECSKNSNVITPLLTDSWNNLKHCAQGQSMCGRHFYDASCLNNMFRMLDTGYIDDEQEFFRFAIDQCAKVTLLLKRFPLNQPIDTLPEFVRHKFILFLQEYFFPLLSHGDEISVAPLTLEETDELTEILSDPKRFRQSNTDLSDLISYHGKQVSSRSDEIGMQFMHDHEVFHDPIIKRIQKRFSLE